jgi:hypothetical protein
VETLASTLNRICIHECAPQLAVRIFKNSTPSVRRPAIVSHDVMTNNTIVGSTEWRSWLDQIRRTHHLHITGFVPREVVLDEGNHLKGLIVPHREVEAVEEVGHKAKPGQVLFWYGDYCYEGSPRGGKAWNAYDVRRNVYLVEPGAAEMVSQAELDNDPEFTLRRLDSLVP